LAGGDQGGTIDKPRFISYTATNRVLTPKVFNPKAQGRPELGEGRTLGKRRKTHETPTGFNSLLKNAVAGVCDPGILGEKPAS
jgi:hypothetical protein